MAVLRTSWSLCLNDQVVPAQTKVCAIVDPYELLGGLDLNLEETEVSLVCFHGTADMSWLMKCLEMPVKWWVHNWNRIPLILEIRERIKAKKNKKEPANRKCLVALQVRGKTLFAVNDTHTMTLGLLESQPLPEEQPGSLKNQAGTLLWFCDELYKDIVNLPKEFQKPRLLFRAPPEHQEAIQRTLDGIQAHPQCKSCHYTPSRLGFRILKKDKKSKEIRVVGLNKRQKPEGAQDPHDKVLSKALEFLEDDVQEESEDGVQEESSSAKS